jgi:hypothetical protein
MIFGSNATLDAGQSTLTQTIFFHGDGSKRKTSLELHVVTLKKGKANDVSKLTNFSSIFNLNLT